MTQVDPNDDDPQQRTRETSKGAPEGDFLVGYGRPPFHGRFKKGRSGNPKGRPKGRPNVKDEIERIMSKKVMVRDGDAEHQLSLVGANVLAHGVKGVKGDVRSAGLIVKTAHTLGMLNDKGDSTTEDAVGGDRQTGALLIGPEKQLSPSKVLFENLDPNLLSREEQFDLSRLAEIIDLGGDITALSTVDFERVKHLVNKGRGKNVTPQ